MQSCELEKKASGLKDVNFLIILTQHILNNDIYTKQITSDNPHSRGNLEENAYRVKIPYKR